MVTGGEPLWRGVGVALVTLFDAAGAVDYAATAAHAARLVDAGVRGVLVAGTTGEADALDDDERARLVAAVRAVCPQVPVMAGASGPWTGAVVARVSTVVKAGADAVLVAPPRRCADVAGFYARVAGAAGDTPVLAYHFPGVAGDAVPVPALASLPVAGVKDSSGDASRLQDELTWPGWTYVGAAPLTGYAGLLGATGAILAIANCAVEDALAAFDGDPAAQARLFAAHRAAGAGGFPAGLKGAVAWRYGTSVAARIG
ncbi:MAG TPA: dihydrodipicolinate synthase family protein [Micromonosporaceae bacterium]